MDATNLIAWLPFNDSATEDRCGNVWTVYGTPTIADAALQLAGNGDANYLECTSIALGGRDFTVHAYCYADSSSPNWARFFSIFKSTAQTSVRISAQATQFEFNGGGVGSISKGARHHLAFCYQHAARTIHCFVDGAKVGTKSITYAENELNKIWIARSEWSGYSTLIGSVDEFMVHDGVALWTENFTPPTAEDYATATVPFVLSFDVERRVKNPLTTWRYVNAGTADDLLVEGTTLTALPKSKSLTGSAFYQTSREKCFDIPATHEIWLKFDVYFDGSNRWRAYNGGTNGTTGITADGNWLNFYSNNNKIQEFSDIFRSHQLRTILLHMVSGSSDGIVEAWVGNTKIYTYTGDVNHGENFADIYLQSDGAGTFFSNVIISNGEIGFDENTDGVPYFFDVERVTLNSEVSAYLPFGNHSTDDLAGNEWILNGEAEMIADSGIAGLDGPVTHFPFDRQLSGFRLKLNCGIWLGGRDFKISFYMSLAFRERFTGSFPFVFYDGEHPEDGFGLFTHLEWTWTEIYLTCFGHKLPENVYRYEYNTAYYVEVNYNHSAGKLNFVLEKYESTWVQEINSTLDITIPPIWFPAAGIGYANQIEHSQGLIRDFKIEGGFAAIPCNKSSISLCVVRNGKVSFLPLRNYEILGSSALTIFYGGKLWYNILREPTDSLASDVYIFHDGKLYALSKE